jgi:hypothetical protein
MVQNTRARPLDRSLSGFLMVEAPAFEASLLAVRLRPFRLF